MTLDPEEELIQRIYAAAYDPHQWVDVMARLSEAMGGLRACLTRIDMATGEGVEAITYRSDPVWIDAYAEHFWQANIFNTSGPESQTADWAWSKPVITDEDCVSRDDYRASEYFNDFLRPQDIDRAAFISLGMAGSVESAINVGRRQGETFEASDLEFAARMQPHMVRAYEIGRRLAAPLRMARTLGEALQYSPHALFLVAADGTLNFANLAGERLLARDRGLTVINRRLTPSHSDSARRFEKLIANAATRGPARTGGSTSIPRPDSHFPLAVRISPLPLDDGTIFRGSTPALVCATDLESEIVAPNAELIDLFGLTAAEVRLATAVFEGLTLPEAAERFAISINTVRFQLARIFDKTGVSRQAELVKLMMRLAAG